MPGRRWRIGGLLGVGVLVNYFDRLSLSVAAPQIQAEFHLSPEQIGFFLSAFFWTYALLQVPAGMLLDRYGPTRIGRWGALAWGVASTLTALAGGWGGIFVARMLLGIAEAPGFMVSSKATGYWFPRGERALATAIFDAAAKFSNVIGVPLVAFVVVGFGWRWGFGICAALSFAYFFAFLAIYRDPSQDPQLTDAEHRYIVEGGATPEGAPAGGASGMLGYSAAPAQGLGPDAGLRGLRLFVLPVPDLAARLSGADHAHEHHQVGGLRGHSVDVVATLPTCSWAAG